MHRALAGSLPDQSGYRSAAADLEPPPGLAVHWTGATLMVDEPKPLSRAEKPLWRRAGVLLVSGTLYAPSARAVPETRMELPATSVSSAVRRERIPMSSP